MHLAKGLEFRAVAVMACDHEVIPLQERIEAVGTMPTSKVVLSAEYWLTSTLEHSGRQCRRSRGAILDELLLVGRASQSPLPRASAAAPAPNRPVDRAEFPLF